jgi:hypothetical protein
VTSIYLINDGAPRTKISNQTGLNWLHSQDEPFTLLPTVTCQDDGESAKGKSFGDSGMYILRVYKLTISTILISASCCFYESFFPVLTKVSLIQSKALP